MIWPAHCHPRVLHGDRMHALRIVVINHIPVGVVVVNNLGIAKFDHSMHSIDGEMLCHLLSQISQSTICRHDLHHIIWFFHCKQVERNII